MWVWGPAFGILMGCSVQMVSFGDIVADFSGWQFHACVLDHFVVGCEYGLKLFFLSGYLFLGMLRVDVSSDASQ